MKKKTQEQMNSIPCPDCLKDMHWCENCQEYHCDNLNCICNNYLC